MPGEVDRKRGNLLFASDKKHLQHVHLQNQQTQLGNIYIYIYIYIIPQTASSCRGSGGVGRGAGAGVPQTSRRVTPPIACKNAYIMNGTFKNT